MADLVGQFVIGKENLNAGRPGAVIDMQGEDLRKSVFIQWRRSRPLTVLDTFDLPRMEPNCEQRNASTVATQSLFLTTATALTAEDFGNVVRTKQLNSANASASGLQLIFDHARLIMTSISLKFSNINGSTHR